MMAESTNNPFIEAIEHYNAGIDAVAAGELRSAVLAWRQALEKDGSLLSARRNLAIAYEELGRNDDALEQWSLLLAIEPRDTEALIRHASALVDAGRRAEAISNYERAIAIYPYYRFWYMEIGDLLEAEGREEDANLWRQRGQRIDADEADMALEDAQGLLREGNLELATTILGAVLEELPGNIEARLTLAQVHSAQGDFKSAMAELDQALERADVARPKVYVHRAACAMRAGDLPAAQRELAAALAIDPKYGRALRLLSSVNLLSESSGVAAIPSPPDPAQAEGQSALVATRDGGWVKALRPMLAEVGAGRGRDGKAGRLGVLYQPVAAITPAIEAFFSLLEDRNVGFLSGGQRIWLCEAATKPRPGANVAQQGWLGSEHSPQLHLHEWGAPPAVTQLEPMLLAAEDAGGPIGFHTLVIIAGGNIRADGPHLQSLLRRLVSERVIVLSLGDVAAPLTPVLDATAPGWRGFALER